MDNKTTVTLEATVKAPVEKVWEFWTSPEHIMQWNNASDDWHTPKAENELRKGGKFSYIMAAKDGSHSFNFGGVFDTVEDYRLIEYTIGDGRSVKILFTKNGESTDIRETFEVENTNPIEMQKAGWQAILENFKKYTEEN